MAVDIDMLNGLCGRYGVPPLELPTLPTAQVVQCADIFGGCDDAGVATMREQVEQEIGIVGQRMWAGQIMTDPNPTYGPLAVRGSYSNPGLYEQIYRTEPLVYDAVRTHTEVLVSGVWELQMPDEVPRGKKAALNKFVTYHNAKLKSIDGGWGRAVEHMCTMIKDGFALHEIIWAKDMAAGRWFIKRLAYRFPATLWRWVMDPMQRQLLAVQFQVQGDRPLNYTLPYAGKRAHERRVLLQSMGGYGNDFEGVAPMRTALVYSKLKQLLIQISAVMADTFGVPLRLVHRDPLWQGTPALASDVRSAFQAVAAGRAVDAQVIQLADGLKVDMLAPGGAMPSFETLIDYCDRQMLVPFSNEGSLLGIATSGGAYALGEVKEREQLRTAPYYARLLADPLNDIFAHLCRDELGPLPDYPKLIWRIDGAEDGSAWLKDVREMMGNAPLPDWPKAIRTVALEKLKLPPDTFKDYDAEKDKAAAAGGGNLNAPPPTEPPDPQDDGDMPDPEEVSDGA